MFIADILSKNKVKVKSSRLMEVKRYFLSMYRCHMIKMYDNDYISDPTKFDVRVITKNVIDMGIYDLFNASGKIDLSSSHVLFAYYKNKEDEDKSEFLFALHKVLEYQEYCKKVDSIYEEFGFKGNISSFINYRMVAKGAKIVQKSNIAFDYAFARCISKFEEDTKCVSIKEELWKLAMRELGVPEDEYENDGLLDSSLSHAEEVECMEGILNGDYKVTNGKYSTVLHNWLLHHRWSDKASTYRAYMRGLYDYLYGVYVKEVEDLITYKLNKLNDEGYNIIAINKDTIYYNVDRVCLDMPFGIFSVVCDNTLEESILPSINILNGYTGELYTEDRLVSDGITFVGCPIIMNDSQKSEGLFYDLEQTDITSSSWFGNDDDISIEFSVDEGNALVNPFDEGTLPHELYNGYKNSLRSPDGLINTINVSNSKELDKAKKLVFKYLEE